MKRNLILVAVLVMVFMLGACGYSLDTLRYAGNTNKEVQAVACEVISIEAPAPKLAAAPVTITKIKEAIMFPFDSSEIIDAEMVKVDKIAKLMKDFSDTNIVINGFASTEGPEDYNLELSQARADSVKAALIAEGVDVDRIVSVIGKGEVSIFGELLKLSRRVVVLSVD